MVRTPQGVRNFFLVINFNANIRSAHEWAFLEFGISWMDLQAKIPYLHQILSQILSKCMPFDIVRTPWEGTHRAHPFRGCAIVFQ